MQLNLASRRNAECSPTFVYSVKSRVQIVLYGTIEVISKHLVKEAKKGRRISEVTLHFKQHRLKILMIQHCSIN